MPIRTIPGLSVASPLAPALPEHDEELVFAHLFGDATLSRNRAGGGAVSNIGTGPTYATDYVTMGQGNGLRTPVTAIHSAMTLMAVVRRGDAGGGTNHRIMNMSGNVIWFWRRSDNVVLGYGANGAAYQAELPITDTSAWHFLTMTIGGGDVVRLRNLTEGTEAEGGVATLPASSSIYLELNALTGSTTQSWTFDWAWAAAISKRLTDEEQDAYRDAITPWLSLTRGIEA